VDWRRRDCLACLTVRAQRATTFRLLSDVVVIGGVQCLLSHEARLPVVNHEGNRAFASRPMRKPDWGQGKISLSSKVGRFFVSGNLDFVWKTAFLLHDVCGTGGSVVSRCLPAFAGMIAAS